MATYKITKIEKVEAEDILKENLDFKTLLNIEFTSTEDNILLLKKLCLMLYQELQTLKNGVKK